MYDATCEYVNLPEYYYKLVEWGSSTLQLTPIGEPFFKLGGEIIDSQNMIRVSLDKTYNVSVGFYWEVKATRKNTEFHPEPLKKDVTINAFGPYTFII